MTWPVFSDVTFIANNASVVINNSTATTGILAGFALHYGGNIYEIIAVGAGTFTLAGDNLPPSNVSNVSVKIQPTAAPFENLLQSALTKANENGDNFVEILNNLRTLATATGTVTVKDAGGLEHAIQGFLSLPAVAAAKVQEFGLGKVNGISYANAHDVAGYGHFVRFESTSINTPMDGFYYEGVCCGGPSFQIVRVSLVSGIASADPRIWEMANRSGTWTGWVEVSTGSNVFKAAAVGDWIAVGFAISSSTARFERRITSEVAPVSISVDGFFNVINPASGTKVSNASPALSSNSGPSTMALNISGMTGLLIGEPLIMTASSSVSKITVNT